MFKLIGRTSGRLSGLALAYAVLFLASAVFAGIPAESMDSIEQRMVAVDCPDEVHVGQAFVLDVEIAEPPEYVMVSWLDKEIKPQAVSRDGVYRAQVLLGAGLTIDPGEYDLVVETVTPSGMKVQRRKIEVSAKDYPLQRLTLPDKMVYPSKQDLERIRGDQARSARAISMFTENRHWTWPFQRPVPGDISSVFGLRRELNGEPRSPHKGVDFRGAEGAEVLACNAGRVIQVDDKYYGGNTVFIDHGQGVVSVYMHLSEIKVEEGREVSKGQVVGLVGSTGRATGPHLHFGLYVQGQAVDPMPLFETGLARQ